MFVLFFVLASVITTVLQLPVSITAPIKELSKFFIVMAMVAIGFNTDIVELVKKGRQAHRVGLLLLDWHCVHKFGDAARAGNLVKRQLICVLRAGARILTVER